MPTRATLSCGRTPAIPPLAGMDQAKDRFNISRIHLMERGQSFLRHEGITEGSELVNVRRALWAIELPNDLPAAAPRLAQPVLTGGIATYRSCQNEVRRLRKKGAAALRAPSAALLPGVLAAGRWTEVCSPLRSETELCLRYSVALRTS